MLICRGVEPPVRVDELFQVLRPQLEGQVFLRVRRGVGRGLLLIAQAEGGQDASDEGGGPAADVSVRDQRRSSYRKSRVCCFWEAFQ